MVRKSITQKVLPMQDPLPVDALAEAMDDASVVYSCGWNFCCNLNENGSHVMCTPGNIALLAGAGLTVAVGGGLLAARLLRKSRSERSGDEAGGGQ